MNLTCDPEATCAESTTSTRRAGATCTVGLTAVWATCPPASTSTAWKWPSPNTAARQLGAPYPQPDTKVALPPFGAGSCTHAHDQPDTHQSEVQDANGVAVTVSPVTTVVRSTRITAGGRSSALIVWLPLTRYAGFTWPPGL